MARGSVNVAGGGGSIKSIQSGITSIAPNTTSKDIAINSIDLNNSIILSSMYSLASTLGKAHATAKITSGTNINFRRGVVDASWGIEIAYTAIEYNNVKSIQCIEFTAFNLKDVLKTISSVDLDKSFVVMTLRNSIDVQRTGTNFIRQYLSAADKLTIYNHLGGAYGGQDNTVTYIAYVIEFK